MAARPPFNMLRAAYWLLAALLSVEVVATLFAGFSCFYLNLITKAEVGACLPVVQQIREQWAEAVAAILALLLAARGGPGGPPGTPPDETPPPGG